MHNGHLDREDNTVSGRSDIKLYSVGDISYCFVFYCAVILIENYGNFVFITVGDARRESGSSVGVISFDFFVGGRLR